MVNSTTSNIGMIVSAVVLLALVAAVAVLTWHGSINGEAAMTFFGAVSGVGGAAAVSHVATKTGARAAKGGE